MNTKYTDRGNIKSSYRQIKKHYSQMTKDELKFLYSYLSGFVISPCKHCIKRKTITKRHIKNAMKAFKIIEFNYNFVRDDGRVLIRSKYEEVLDDGNKYNLCLVISLYSGDIVTMYWNLAEDSHDTINYGRYSNFKVIDYMGY